ncbi:hypothetical protein Ancab_025238 [Ancistrocladus abbreviatus]
MSTKFLQDACQNGKADVTRPTANFHPHLWGDRFLNYTSDDEAKRIQMQKQASELKKEVRKELLAIGNKPLEQLNFIDAIEHLGVAYHFEKEITEALEQIYDTYNESNYQDDLYHVALRFRLLRQHGFYVSCDVFKIFTDEEGKFMESLASDTRSILCLYEASHIRVHGDDLLDEALAFTSRHLKSMATQMSCHLAEQVAHALKQPFHKGMLRLESRLYIPIYEQNPFYNKTLLKFAKLDFNLLQMLHNEELREISRWWKGLDLVRKLPFIRDRVAEAYFWSFGPYYEPEYRLARIIFCKVFKMASIIDDIYDAYGTIEELELLTGAIDRWDMRCINELPEYMKLAYEALLNTFEQFEGDLLEGERSYRVHYAREQMKALCRAYLIEARWRDKKYVPTFDEYMSNAIISFGYILGTVVSYLGMGEIATKEAFEWASQNPKVVNASGIIGRLLDDMGSHNFEQRRDHISSAVECYMRQYNVSEEQACRDLHGQVEEAWKDVNQSVLQPSIMPLPLLTRILNLCRVVEVIYKGEDCYTIANRTMKDHIALMFIDPISL